MGRDGRKPSRPGRPLSTGRAAPPADVDHELSFEGIEMVAADHAFLEIRLDPPQHPFAIVSLIEPLDLDDVEAVTVDSVRVDL